MTMPRHRYRTALLVCFAFAILARHQRDARAGLPTARLVLIAPGTPVGERAPEGWSDLVVKSTPKLETGDLATLPAFAASTAALFRTVFLAEVGVDPKTDQRVLKRIGLGLAMPENGVDVIVSGTSGSARHEPAALGFVERRVLASAEVELRKMRLLVATPTLAVLTAPSLMKSARGHEKIILIYALILNGKSGEMRTVVWWIPQDSERRSPPDRWSLLPKNLNYTCAIDVAAERLLNTLPVNWSFAMSALPPGREMTIPSAFKQWTTDLKAIAADPSAFENALRACLSDVPGVIRRETGRPRPSAGIPGRQSASRGDQSPRKSPRTVQDGDASLDNR